MTDWGQSGRTDTFTVVKVDPFSLSEVGEPLEIVPDACELSWDWDSENLVTGAIEISGFYSGGRDYMLRVKQFTTIGDESFEKELATLFIDEPTSVSTHGFESTTCAGYGVLLRYSEDQLVQDHSWAAGDKVLDAITFIVESRGGILVIGDGVNQKKTFGDDAWFELGSNILEVLQELAGFMGCRIGCDGHGNVTLDLDEDRAAVYEFTSGENCVYLPGITWAEDRSELINRVEYYYTSEDATLVALYDLPEGYRGSFERIGRYIPEIVKYTDEITQSELNTLAKNYLYEHAGITESYEIEHVGVPDINIGDIVTFEDSLDFPEPVAAQCRVMQMTLNSFTPGAMCSSKLLNIDIIEKV